MCEGVHMEICTVPESRMHDVTQRNPEQDTLVRRKSCNTSTVPIWNPGAIIVVTCRNGKCIPALGCIGYAPALIQVVLEN